MLFGGSNNIHHTLFHINVFRNTLSIDFWENGVLDINAFNETLFFTQKSMSSKKCGNHDKSQGRDLLASARA